MKKYIYNITKAVGLALVLILVLSSCDKWIDTEINIDPDAPADVSMNLMLPAIEQAVGFNMAGNDMVRSTALWAQQFDGVDRQSLTQTKYQYTSADVNNLWNTMYTSIFMNAIVFIDKAENTEGKESPHNAGVAKVLTATTLGIATDVFGDMPFSDAFKGSEGNLKPMFDTQEIIYATIFSTLDAAIADLGSATNAIDIEGDVVYGGDADAWKKAAYSVKARHLLQLSGVNGNAAYTDALAAVANGFSSNADDFEVPWEAANPNPLWQFMDERTDIRMGSTFVNLLKSNDDPRLPFYAAKDGDGEYTGSDPGSVNEDASKLGNYIAGKDASSIMMSYAELKFIEAEALFVTGGDAQTAYEAAVTASVLKVTGVANTAWLAGNIIGIPVTLELIMTQKYIATYGTNQPYADYRRTGFPDIMVDPIHAVLPEMPTRFPYSQVELTFNGANVPIVSISDKLWWN